MTTAVMYYYTFLKILFKRILTKIFQINIKNIMIKLSKQIISKKKIEWPEPQCDICTECGSLHDWRFIKTGWCCNCGAAMKYKKGKK